MAYSELQVTSNFSFLRGGSHPEELVQEAARLGYSAIAITDMNTVAGLVRAHTAAKAHNIRLIPGCRLELLDGPSLLAYPTNTAAWARLCTLLTVGNSRTEKGSCHLYIQDVLDHAEGLHFIALPPKTLNDSFDLDPAFEESLFRYRQAFEGRLSLAVTRHYGPDDAKMLHRLYHLSRKLAIPLVATNDVWYHHPDRRQLQDILTCIKEGCTITSAGYRLMPNAERYLKPDAEMTRLFRAYPEALDRAGHIAAACTFSLDSLEYEYPEELTTGGRTPQEELTMLAWQGAEEHLGLPLPPKVRAAIEYELKFIREMDYAPYFLTVHDIVRYARSRGILCQGRGSAANSTVCFCLGITSVNPEKFDLLFERFISAARNEPPDIDVDFEHERREEVIQYIYSKYGRHRAAIIATVTQMHQKGALRDVGKVMGLSEDTIKKLSSSIWEFTDEWFDGARLEEQGLNPHDPHLKKVLSLTAQYMGFPRQLGQHTGGFVITRNGLANLCPVLNARMPGRTCIEWNKDDIEALGFLKIDILALGMLTCIRKAFDLVQMHWGRHLTLATIPQDDPAVYDMICAADTIGVFQIESRAQQTMLPRLRPRNFYDLVIEVAIVRPGPIQGDMVHPYLRRRNGEEPVDYPSEEIRQILERTLGVPLFQEQAMKIAITAAGFTPAEADGLRRSMATFKFKGVVSAFQDKLIRGMTSRGYTREYAEKVFRQLEGFGSYGFPESHAASFAQLVYVSSWLKCRYPAVFAAALLNSMPMGFYQPAQIVIDAQKHGVEVRGVDVSFSHWDCTLEDADADRKAIRLGFRQVRGLRKGDADVLLAHRSAPFASLMEVRDTGIPQSALELLAAADAFRSLGLDRRQALWELSAKDGTEALFKGQAPPDSLDEAVTLTQMAPSEGVVADYSATSLSIKAHPVSFLRSHLARLGVTPSAALTGLANGQPVKVSGLVLVRQRPGTAGGVCFMTIEDEGGFSNLVIFSNLFEQYRKAILGSRLIMAEGTLQVQGSVIHVIVTACYDLSSLLRRLLPGTTNPYLLTLARGDEKSVPPSGDKRSGAGDTLFGEARNFK